jgi:circadian clock protein KaiC
MIKNKKNSSSIEGIEKCPTGIAGLDEITEGGLPRGRPTLICGGAGSGKTLLSMEFLIRGITQFNEPGVFMTFEETVEELAKNVASLGFDVGGLIEKNKLAIDHVHIERSEIEETGEYDLEWLGRRMADTQGLFVDLDNSHIRPLPDDLTILIFESVREKHAQTNSVCIRINETDGGRVN